MAAESRVDDPEDYMDHEEEKKLEVESPKKRQDPNSTSQGEEEVLTIWTSQTAIRSTSIDLLQKIQIET